MLYSFTLQPLPNGLNYRKHFWLTGKLITSMDRNYYKNKTVMKVNGTDKQYRVDSEHSNLGRSARHRPEWHTLSDWAMTLLQYLLEVKTNKRLLPVMSLLLEWGSLFIAIVCRHYNLIIRRLYKKFQSTIGRWFEKASN